MILDGDVEWSHCESDVTAGQFPGRYVIPDGGLGDKKRDIEDIVKALLNFDDDQTHLDGLYDQLIRLMSCGFQRLSVIP